VLRFSANLGFLWPDRPLPERIAAAGRAGFRAVELHFPYDTPASETKAACTAAGVTLLGINTNIDPRPGGHLGLAAVPGREADFAALIDQSIAYQVAAGGTAIHVMAGLVPEAERATGTETLVKNLALAAEKAAPHGLTLLLEPLNPNDNPGYFYSTVEPIIAVIERVAAPNLKLMFDAYHVGRAEGDVIRRLREFWPHVGHVQIAAVPSRAEPDEGELNFRAIFALLEELGYAGWIGAEYRPRGDTGAGLTWVERLGVAL
jgi:2-dehydrotetronate isomerase